MPASANIADKSGWRPQHQTVIWYRPCYEGGGPYHGKTTDAHIGDDYRACSNGSAVPDQNGAFIPVICLFEHSIGVDGAWHLVVGQASARPNKDAILYCRTGIDSRVVLDLDIRSDLNAAIDVDILTHDAIIADVSVFSDLGVVPDSNVVADDGGL
ncbi:MAG TPA: hypothetical protein VJK02_05245 [Anaerolineales bacterium]|nr:hypothetical protein [Anaerolineales bacterium]